MKKKYITNKTREELYNQINYLSNNYRNLCIDKDLFFIKFISDNKIRVGYGRGQTVWKLNFETQGEINVERCMTFTDWLLIVTFGLIDIAFICILIYNGLELNDLLIILILILTELIPSYYLYITSPLKKITCFIKKYL